MALKLPRCPPKLPSLRAGLGALISGVLTAQASQCSVELAAPGNLILELLELTKLISVFELYPTLDAATVASREQAA